MQCTLQQELDDLKSDYAYLQEGYENTRNIARVALSDLNELMEHHKAACNEILRLRAKNKKLKKRLKAHIDETNAAI